MRRASVVLLSLILKLKGPLLLGLLVLIPFWDLLWLPADQTVAGNDLNSMFLQWWRFGLDSLRGGELPLWNPYLFSGVPFVANPQPALFYPPMWLLLVFSAAKVAALLLVLHLWLAAVGMYGWLRSEEADEMGAFFGAVVFAFSGYFAARLCAGHLGVVMTQAWLPAILWAYRRALKSEKLSGAILGGLLVALSVLAGHIASFLYVGLVWAAYALFCAWRAWQRAKAPVVGARPLLFAGVMVLIGLGLAAVQLLPTWEFIRLSTRQETTYAFAADYSWPPGYLLTLLVPNFFGQPGRVGYWGDGFYGEMIFYAGVLPLFLILSLGFRKGLRYRLFPFLLAIGGIGLFLALGQFSILHRLAYNFVPLFQVTRVPARAGFMVTFAIAALSGLLLTWLRREPAEARPDLRRWTRGLFLWVTVSVTLLVVLGSFFLFALERDSNSQVGRLWHLANSSALFLLFFLLAVGLMRAWGSGGLNARQGALLAIGLVLLDLWGSGRSLIQPALMVESAYWRIVSEVTAGGGGRVLPWGLSIFEHNQGMRFGLENVFGYDPLELERYSRFITQVPDPQARAYDLLRARYLITTQEMSFDEEKDVPQLIDQREGVWIYERPGAFPEAWLVHQVEVLETEQALLARLNDPAFDPRQAALVEGALPCLPSPTSAPEDVRVTRRTHNTITLDVQAAADGLLILSEVAYPGWRVSVDGQRVPIVRADHTLRAVCVPPGTHRVTFSFLPTSLVAGGIITLLTGLVVGWAGLKQVRGINVL